MLLQYHMRKICDEACVAAVDARTRVCLLGFLGSVWANSQGLRANEAGVYPCSLGKAMCCVAANSQPAQPAQPPPQPTQRPAPAQQQPTQRPAPLAQQPAPSPPRPPPASATPTPQIAPHRGI